jgi:hypothetical protein
MANNFVNYSNMTALMAAIGNKFKTAVARAANVSYDNTDSGLEATNVQDAIDEINFIKIEYSDYIELTDYEKEHHNWKLMNAPVDPPTPPGPDVPDGKTVTPINDVVIWQQCAGLTSTYTTLDEVLADSCILSALMASNNAVDYMVRSTTWAVSMTVPPMTSATTPSGKVTASSQPNANRPAWKAFNGVMAEGDNSWETYNGSSDHTDWIDYEFTSPIVLSGIDYFTSGINRNCTYRVQGSNDGITYEDIKVFSNVRFNSRTLTHETVISNKAFTHIRIYFDNMPFYGSGYYYFVGSFQFYGVPPIPENATAMSYIGLNNYCANTLLADSTWCNAICNSEYFESVLNVKVPTMTSNTTPSGVGVCVSTNDSPSAYKAFDGDDSTLYSLDTSSDFTYCGFHFNFPFKAYKAFSIGRDNRDQKHKIIASNDGITWTDLSDFVTYTSAMNRRNTFLLNPSIPYSYYADQIAKDGTYGLDEYTLQFWGREDV